jgi:tetratricopeptide (TPR) repeat protein
VIRQNDKLKSTASGKELCTTSRLNIALCKINLEQYDECVDQCERVLDTEPKNWKASFRLASALNSKAGDKGSEKEIKTIFNYAKKAVEGNPNDKKVREFHDEIKVKYEQSKKESESYVEEVKDEAPQ